MHGCMQMLSVRSAPVLLQVRSSAGGRMKRQRLKWLPQAHASGECRAAGVDLAGLCFGCGQSACASAYMSCLKFHKLVHATGGLWRIVPSASDLRSPCAKDLTNRVQSVVQALAVVLCLKPFLHDRWPLQGHMTCGRAGGMHPVHAIRLTHILAVLHDACTN